LPRNALADLHRDIVRYISHHRSRVDPCAGPLTMPDMLDKARRCQERIDQLGFRWDPIRLLWRFPRRERNRDET
jgi:hypothetical protein